MPNVQSRLGSLYPYSICTTWPYWTVAVRVLQSCTGVLVKVCIRRSFVLQGQVKDKCIVCPAHDTAFDLATGEQQQQLFMTSAVVCCWCVVPSAAGVH